MSYEVNRMGPQRIIFGGSLPVESQFIVVFSDSGDCSQVPLPNEFCIPKFARAKSKIKVILSLKCHPTLSIFYIQVDIS